MHVEDPGEPWTVADARAVGRAEWIQVGALTRADFPPDVLAALARDRRLALDGQALVRPAATGELDARRRLRSGGSPLRHGAQALRRARPRCSVARKASPRSGFRRCC